jgi:dihydroorotate dehydrogenase
LEAEKAHHLTLSILRMTEQVRLISLMRPPPVQDPQTVMGLQFKNSVGLAAGLDKDGAFIDAFAALGFGFIEIGTVTPRPQAGNPVPRLFRVPQAQALINRMGFNNAGVETLIHNIQSARFKGILGINIGKNASTPIAQAVDDYLYCLEKVYPFASYVTVNISSPNTQNLRSLQETDALDALLSALNTSRKRLADQHSKYVPIALKIAPDLTGEQVKSIAEALTRHHMDGVIATNTTLSRVAVSSFPSGAESGGLSGRPLLNPSNTIIRTLYEQLGTSVPIIGVGGILSAQDACEKRAAGAALIQLYTGLIYRGPALVQACAKALKKLPQLHCTPTEDLA